jgi:acyl-CoA synthetase (AMP-forming)/AMP-acid ligase II
MILGEGSRSTANSAATLDDLFRRAGVRHPDAIALADPPNREKFIHGAPRILNFAQADRAISAFAAKLRGLGLQTDSVVALHLPNTVESVVGFLGVLRAGMIAVPLPLLWRRQDLVAALDLTGVKAIITCSRIGAAAHADIAMQTAVDLFSIRHVCAFGPDLPDGIVSFDDVFDFGNADISVAYARPNPGAAHVAAITFGVDANGIYPIARSHVELVAGGLETFLEAGCAADTSMLSAIPIGSFAGIALTVSPWLLSGGALHLHHGFYPDAFVAQCRVLDVGAVTLPAAAIAAIAETGLLNDAKQTTVALWRAPERLTAAAAWENSSPLIDVASFGEIGIIAARRGETQLPTPIPCGVVDSPRRAPGAPRVIETVRSDVGTLKLRGRMVPAKAFPPGVERGHTPRYSGDAAGYVDTGYACRVERDGRALVITAPPPGVVVIGGYRFTLDEVDDLVAQADADATIVALPDADLGQRLAGHAANRVDMLAKLEARGASPLICGAFQPRGASEAA